MDPRCWQKYIFFYYATCHWSVFLGWNHDLLWRLMFHRFLLTNTRINATKRLKRCVIGRKLHWSDKSFFLMGHKLNSTVEKTSYGRREPFTRCLPRLRTSFKKRKTNSDFIIKITCCHTRIHSFGDSEFTNWNTGVGAQMFADCTILLSSIIEALCRLPPIAALLSATAKLIR